MRRKNKTKVTSTGSLFIMERNDQVKQKHWQVSAFDKTSETIRDDTFYTTDTEAYLVFELIDEDFTPDSATVTVYNIYGKATINASVEVADGIVRYEIPEEAIGHPGGWRTQVIFTKDNEDYTTKIIEFDVGGHLLDNKKPAIVDIENWNTFIAHAEELIDDWEQLEEIRQANEQQRELAESVRQNEFETNETSRQTNELVREEAENNRQSTFETNETERQNEFEENELTRGTAESGRQSTFETNETGRQNEFETNEAERDNTFEVSESARQANELIREEAEGNRQSTFEENETERQAEFEENEQGRESAESVRVSNEAERISKDSERDSKIEAVEGLQADLISGAVDSAAVQQHVEERYGQLEEEYAPRLTEVTSQLAQTQQQFNQAVGAVTEDSEVVLARSEYTTLKERLDAEKAEFSAHKEDYTTQRQQDNLKIATVEKGLNDYKSTMASVNVNQEAKQKVTGYGAISLPKNTANGQANISLKGNTITDETGTNSTISASRLKSVGKNLFDGILESGFISGLTGLNITDLVWVRSKNYIEVSPNTTYTLSSSKNNRGVRCYDSSKAFIISFNAPLQSNVFTTPPNCVYIRITNTSTDLNEPIQLERGAIATPYEPYTESTQYLPNVGELRSVPSAKDEVSVSGGKGEWIKRVGIKTSTTIVATSTPTNVDYIRIFNPPTDNVPFVNEKQDNIALYYNDLSLTQIPFADANQILSIGKYFTNLSGVWLVVKKGVIPTVNHTLTYQLAKPIITPINVSGTLLSHPSGTVYVENVVADAGSYTDKVEIINTSLPIKELDQLTKMDFETGVEQELDLTEAVVSEDGLSFTHPNLAIGDLMFFEYYYQGESTDGLVSVGYYDSRYTIKDSVTDKVYKWSISVADGVPSIELEEA